MNNNGQPNETLERIERLLKVMVKLKITEFRGDKTQNELIFLLDSLGCGTAEIAELLGTTRNSVSPVLSRAKRKGN